MNIKVGTFVELKRECLGNPAGTIGICYEEYDIGKGKAGSFIFENGNYDGFSPEEQDEFLNYIGDGATRYDFENVMKLCEDFYEDKFKAEFETGKQMREDRNIPKSEIS